MYKLDKKTKEIVDIRWFKEIDDSEFHLEKLVRTSEYIYNDDPNCPENLKIVAVPKDEWESVAHFVVP